MRFPLLIATLALSCGATNRTAPSRDSAGTAREDEAGAGSVSGNLAAVWTGRGEAAFAAGDFDRADEAFDRALQAGADSPRVRIGKARCLLAKRRAADAAQILVGTTDPRARTLRAIALYVAGAPEAAFALEEVAPRTGFARDAHLLSRALRGSRPIEVDGRRANVPLLTDLPLPAVPAVADRAPVRLLIDIGAFETVVDRAVAERLHWSGDQGVIGTLDLGNITLKNVPAVVRDLSPLGRSLGAPVTGVLGLRVLEALHATLDYPAGWLALKVDAPDVSGNAARVPFYTVDGQYLTVRGKVDDAHGALLVSGGGTFALALSDHGLSATGRRAADLRREADGFARYAVRTVRLAGLEVSDVPAVHFVFPERLSDETGVRYLGVLSHAFLAQWRVSVDTDRGQLVFERGEGE